MKIEKTFIISLPYRLTDRLIPLIDYLKSIELDYFTYSATYHVEGQIGLLITIESLLTECVNEGYETIMVWEDDAKVVVDNLKEVIEESASQLPEEWDCLYLGVNLFQDNVELFSKNLIRIKSGWATHAIIFSKSGMIKTIEAIRRYKHNKIPLDEIMVKHVQSEGNCFCTYPMFISQHNGYSDIQKKEMNYEKILENRFKEKTAHL